MRKFKTVLAVFMFLGLVSASYADESLPKSVADKNLNYSAITPTAFSTQLKKSPTYNAPTYNMPYYSNYIQSNPILNAEMNGLVNSMTMGTGCSSFAPEMLNRQQEEYTRQQMQRVDKEDIEQQEPAPPVQGNDFQNPWW